MNRHQLAAALRRITANTKRLAKATAALEVSPRKKPRMVSPRRRHTRAEPYNPPRAPEPAEEPYFAPALPFPPMVAADVLASVEEGLISAAEAEELGFVVPIPAPGRPVVRETASPAPIEPPAQRIATMGRSGPSAWVGSCTAVCAETGLKCRLPAHPGDEHRSERGAFIRVAVAGQTHFARRDALVEAATRAPGIGFTDKLNEAHIEHGAAEQARRRRVVAHLGDATTAGNNEKASDLRGAGAR